MPRNHRFNLTGIPQHVIQADNNRGWYCQLTQKLGPSTRVSCQTRLTRLTFEEKTSQLVKQCLLFPLIVFFRNEVLFFEPFQSPETILEA